MKPGQTLAELLRPQQLSDLTLPQPIIDRLQRMRDEQSLMNMLFHGGPGTGKTSAARILGEAAGKHGVYINVSSLFRKDFETRIIPQIIEFAFRSDLADPKGDSRQRLCFIDEAEQIPMRPQAMLRHLIDFHSENCRFLFAVNDKTKINPALRSRLVPICFDLPVSESERLEIKARLYRRCAEILTREGIPFDERRLIELIAIYYRDLRQMIEQVELEFRYGHEAAQ